MEQRIEKMSNRCFKCSDLIKSDHIKCSGLCGKYFHSECIQVESKVKEVLLSTKNLKWFCDYCLNHFDKLMETKQELVEIKKLITQKRETPKNEDQLVKKKTYAEKAGEVVVIKPKSTQETQATKEAIKKVLNPSELEIGITEMKNLKEGGILIRCQSKNEVEKIRDIAEKKLNKRKYEVTVPKQKNPKIKIVGIEDKLDEAELTQIIKSQNSFLKTSELFDIKVIRKMKNKYLAIVEVDPKSYHEIMKTSKLSIGWCICSVYEYVSVLRCFNCGQYDHVAKECKECSKCLYCASINHKTSDCDNKIQKCCNCIAVNKKYNMNLNVNHTIFDVKCPVYLKKVEIGKRNVRTAFSISGNNESNSEQN